MERKHKVRLYVYTGLTLAIMVAIFMFSAQAGDDSKHTSEWLFYSPFGQWLMHMLPKLSENGLDADIRKYAHMFEFACLGLSCTLMFNEMVYPKKSNLFWLILGSIGFVFFYGATDEIHQLFVPERLGCFKDVLVDTFGGTLGVLYSSFWIYRKIKGAQNEE